MQIVAYHRRQAVAEEAAYWCLVAKVGPKLSLARRREFVAWLRQSPENIAELMRITELYEGCLKKTQFVLQSEKPREARQRCISHAYATTTRSQHFIPKLALVMVGCAAGMLATFLRDASTLAIAGCALACLLLIMMKDSVLTFRVASGMFGSAESEVRDLIQFMIENAEENDFTDDDMKPMRSLVPPSEAARERDQAIDSGVVAP